jgi:hypothetical protein
MINQKQFNEIQAYFNEHKGATIFLGYVFHIVEAVYIEFMEYKSGYVVSYQGGINIASLDLTKSVINNFLMENIIKIRDGSNSLGLWLSPIDNRLYIDISRRYDSIHNAIDTANANNQSHIFDCKAQKSLNVKTLQYE